MIVTINPGSTSYRFCCYAEDQKILAKAKYYKTGKQYFLRLEKDGVYFDKKISVLTFKRAGRDFFKRKIITELIKNHPLDAIVVRYVHGGEKFFKPFICKKRNLSSLKKLNNLAPLHNPVSFDLLKKYQDDFPKIPLVLVFDTEFHLDNTAKEISNTYAIPAFYRKKYGIKPYGFHGLACASVVDQLRQVKKLKNRSIICHLGGGCSVTALVEGKSIWNSMQFSPESGVMSPTRSGTIDAAAILYLKSQTRLSYSSLLKTLYQESGIKALCGSADIALVVQRAQEGRGMEKSALDLFCKSIAENILKASLHLSGTQQLIFSGGIGFNSSYIRKNIIDLLAVFGFKINISKNRLNKSFQDISSGWGSPQIILVDVDENKQLLKAAQSVL